VTRSRALATGTAVTVAIVAVARWLAYALASAPDPRAREVVDAFPLARIAALCAVAVVVAALVGGAVLWIAAVGVRERERFAAVSAPLPRPSARRLGVRAAILLAASATAFASVESYVHYRAGLGFHAVHCLSGPVHANAWPILVGLAILASALWEAAAHVAAFARRSAVAAALGGLVARRARVVTGARPPRPAYDLVLAARTRSRAPPGAPVPR
jgi:hypothetical protein